MNFYLFGRRRIKQLEESLAEKDRLFEIQQQGWRESNEKLRAAQNQVEYLVRTIRDMDQEIWNMGQKTDWNQQRPHFVKLHDEMTARKVAESKRIGDVLRGELISTYAPNMAQKRLK
jgi:hypothetical protein